MAKVRPEEKTTPAGPLRRRGRDATPPARKSSGSTTARRCRCTACAWSIRRSAGSSGWRRRIRPQRRISYGCINVPVAFFESVVWPLLRTTRAVTYVLPETRSVDEVFAGAYDQIMKVAARAAGPSAGCEHFPTDFPTVTPVDSSPAADPPPQFLCPARARAHRRPGGESGCRVGFGCCWQPVDGCVPWRVRRRRTSPPSGPRPTRATRPPGCSPAPTTGTCPSPSSTSATPGSTCSRPAAAWSAPRRCCSASPPATSRSASIAPRPA